MTNNASENMGQKSIQLITLSDSTKIGVFVHLLDIIIKVGRYSPVVSLSLTSLNFLLAINDFLSNNIGFAILNSLLAISGFIFLIQMRKMNKDRPHLGSHYTTIQRIHTIRGLK